MTIRETVQRLHRCRTPKCNDCPSENTATVTAFFKGQSLPFDQRRIVRF
jgi:hypothetical protein